VALGKRELRVALERATGALTLVAQVPSNPTRLTLKVRDAKGVRTTLHVKVKRSR
jgi:hypothetical protein